MSLIVIEHQPGENSARLGQVLQQHGHRLRIVRPAQGEPFPPDLDDVDGLVVMGGDMNVGETEKHPWLAAEMALMRCAHAGKVPIVGVCLGAQLLAAALGGEVGPMEKPEIGWFNVKLAFPGTTDALYGGITWDSMQFHIHGQEVKKLPPDSTPLAGSARCRTQAFRVGLRSYGFQYHFECDRASIDAFAACGFAAGSGVSGDQILAETQKYYDGYARQSQRLCENISLLLFPIDKR